MTNQNDLKYEELEAIIKSSPTLMSILQRAKEIGMKEYYIGAGCVTQLVWNKLSAYEDLYGIKDIDFVYYKELSNDSEFDKGLEDQVKKKLGYLGIDVDVTNEAYVHTWYKSKFGFDIQPYTSLENAIDTWPSTASAMGVRLEENEKIKIYAPFGLDDLLEMIVRPNKTLVTKEIYMNKARKWKEKWPKLRVIDW